MASLAFVDGALQDMELLGKDFVQALFNAPLQDLQMGLRHLRTFLLYARNCNTISTSLGSFLSRIEDAVIGNAMDFHNLCLKQKNEISSWFMHPDMRTRVDTFKNCIYF
ncbi:hypothetical protein ACH5RR_009569 [Cinchona calisaya]|uniref:Uncharacterized protein n=1 Tax=Cinchona calisaya TaxID=153742 RepID=A0ABD3AEU2_9GENT